MGFLQETRKKKKILVGALAVSMVTLILGLGLGLGLELQRWKNKVVPQTSCRSRCYEPFDGEVPGCRCDRSCNQTNSCCFDFYDLCFQPAQQWECTRLRCGEKRLSSSNCHCSDDCGTTGDCCTNYLHVCKGQKQWVEEDCEDLTAAQCPSGFKKQPLLVVSLDGWRAEYMQTWSGLVPVVDKLQKCGTSAPFMQAAFPSKTFPNHYSIVTGLYPESNGLIDNNMYDPEMDASFSLSSPEKDNPAWYLGQPIWHTATYQGLKSGTFFWPGSDVKVNGSFPDIYRPYNGKVPFEERVFTVLKWLQLPNDKRPDLFTLYLEEPDKSGHSYGPVSGGLIEALQGVDRIMGQLMNGLQQLGLHRCLNIIVVADHGMEATSCERKEVLRDFVGDVDKYWVNEGPFGRIRARDKDTVIDAAGLVSNMTCKKPGQKIRPYLKTDLPKRLHFANSRRIEDVNVLVTPQWLFERNPGSLTFCSGGNHGYDNDAESMHAMFLSYGPKFKSKTVVEPFSNIELYNLMCDVLEISPAQNNGTHGSLNHLLRQPYYSPTPPQDQSPAQTCPLTSLDPAEPQGCSCAALTDNSINSRLNLSSAQELESERTHLPFGAPVQLQSNQSYCRLHHQGFVSAFSKDHLMPLWSSYSLSQPSSSSALGPVMADCLRPDVRVPPSLSPRCDAYNTSGNIRHGFLYPPNLNGTAEQQFDALTTSNIVPMFPAFNRIWSYFHDVLLMKYSRIYNGINVLSGPVFDYNYDGRYDAPEQIQQFVSGTKIPIPTHYFIVLTSCRDSSKPVLDCDGELQTVSFILPHKPDNTESCRIQIQTILGALLLSSLALTALSVPGSDQTFKDRDPVSGKPVECNYCPPGTFLSQSCTSTRPRVCTQCPSGSFTEIWNYIGKCLRCGICGRNMVEKTKCMPQSNCKCECKQGYYYKETAGMCVQHSECGTGSGVAVRGTPHQNTVCEVCTNGTFSDIVSSEGHCIPHTNCEAQGLKVMLKGSIWHNTICFKYEINSMKDGGDYLRQILPSFFSHHQLSLRRLRHVVTKLPSADGTKTRRSVSGLGQSELMTQLDSWVKNSSAELLRKLPLILTETGANYTAERLQNKLKRIDASLSQLCEMNNNEI